jgi:hypothetical protein
MTDRIPRIWPAGLLALALVAMDGAGARGDDGRWVGTKSTPGPAGRAVSTRSSISMPRPATPPSRLSAAADGGDHLHPGHNGYTIMAGAVDLELFGK